MPDLFRAFDSAFFEKTRLSIMSILASAGEASWNELKADLGASDGALYSHLEKLREGGYIDRRREMVRESPSTIYWLTDLGKERFSAYLGTLEHIVRTHSKAK